VQLLCRLGPRAAVEVFGLHGSHARHIPWHHGLLAERGEAPGSEAAAQLRRHVRAEVSAAGDSEELKLPPPTQRK
jgi:hypothetical protein